MRLTALALCLATAAQAQVGVTMDLAQQKADTFWVFDDIARKHGMPEMAIVDFQFVPQGPAPDPKGLTEAARAMGLKVRRYEDELELSKPVSPMSAEAIWELEKALTLLAARFGYAADGWGFWEPPTDTPTPTS